MFGTGEKKQIGIWIFLVVQKINFLGPLKVNMDTVYLFLYELFSFYEKVPYTLDHSGFSSNFFFFFLVFDIFY